MKNLQLLKMSETIWIEVRGHELSYIANFFRACETEESKEYWKQNGLDLEILNREICGKNLELFPNENMVPCDFLRACERYGEEYIKRRKQDAENTKSETEENKIKRLIMYACPTYLLHSYATKRHNWTNKKNRMIKPKGNIYDLALFRSFYSAPFKTEDGFVNFFACFWETYKYWPANLTINNEKKKSSCDKEIVSKYKNITVYVPFASTIKVLELVNEKCRKSIKTQNRRKVKAEPAVIQLSMPEERKVNVIPIFPLSDTWLGLEDYKRLRGEFRRRYTVPWKYKYIFKGVFDVAPLQLQPNTFGLIVGDLDSNLNIKIEPKIISHSDSFDKTLLSYTKTCYFEKFPSDEEIEISRSLAAISVAKMMIYNEKEKIESPATSEHYSNDTIDDFFKNCG